MKKITFNDIRKTLTQSQFNPNIPIGPIKIIMEQDDPLFYEKRAIEMIREAQNCLENLDLYSDLVGKAISLLALAKTLRLKQV